MTVNVEEIVRERLATWGSDCIRDHATPVLLVSVGHDQAEGEVHLYVPDDPRFNDATIRAFLRFALPDHRHPDARGRLPGATAVQDVQVGKAVNEKKVHYVSDTRKPMQRFAYTTACLRPRLDVDVEITTDPNRVTCAQCRSWIEKWVGSDSAC